MINLTKTFSTTTTSFFTGGKIVAKGKGVECCGNEAVGEIYNQKKEICCQWWYTGEFAVHKNQNKVSKIKLFVI